MIFSKNMSIIDVLNKFFKNIGLAVGSISLLFASYFFGQKDSAVQSNLEASYLDNIQKSVVSHQAKASSELDKIAENILSKSKRNFEHFAVKTKYPYVVFENGKPVYWSSNGYFPTIYEFRSFSKKKYGNTPAGQFLVNGHTLKTATHLYEIYNFEFLKRNYTFENDYLRSNYNASFFTDDPQAIFGVASSNKKLNITDQQQQFLFSVVPPLFKNQKALNFSKTAMMGFMLSVSAFLLGIWWWVRKKYATNPRFRFSLFGVLGVVVFRIFTLYFSLPFGMSTAELFSPRLLSISRLNPSIGDVLLNHVLLIFVFFLIAKYYKGTSVYKNSLLLPTKHKRVVAFAIIGLSVLFFSNQLHLLRSLYKANSLGLTLGIDNNINRYKLLALLIFLLSSILFFVQQHVVINFFNRLITSRKEKLRVCIMGAVLCSGVAYWICKDWLVFILPLYAVFVYYYKFYRNINIFRYAVSIYLFSAAFFCAMVGFVVHVEESKKTEVYNKKLLAAKILSENDLFIEGILSKAAQQIEVDSTIIKAVDQVALAPLIVKQRIFEKYLPYSLDKFDTEVLLFDAQDSPIEAASNARSLAFYKDFKKIPEYQTQYQDLLFFESLKDSIRQGYLVFVPLSSREKRVGTLVLKLATTGSTQGDFLQNRRVIQTANPTEYSYGVYINKELKQQFGPFNFQRNFPKAFLNKKALYSNDLIHQGYEHLGLSNAANRTIVISSKPKNWLRTVADFSFLFMLLSIFILSYIIYYAYFIKHGGASLNFGTRIQTYVNAAFILPLIALVFITISVVSSLFLENQSKAYLQNAQNINQNLRPSVESYNKGLISQGFLEEEVSKLARELKQDIHLYDLSGSLIATSKPLLFEYNILSRKINPAAYSKIYEKQEFETLEDEQIGKLTYKAAYINMMPRNILGLPFYESKITIDTQIANIVSYIISLFSIIFIALLVLSYFASRVLTVPLSLITQKIQKINLSKKNETLNWSANDEIGMLIKEYNRMLEKLEESKQALAMSEKQTAWREMAKQVAHEIKNPLTPMKLSVQQLQRTLSITEDLRTKEKITRALNSLIEQIDTISDIAQSFSDFAKMPVPRSEVFDMVEVLQSCANLYGDDDRISLNSYIRETNAYVIGDRQLMSRIITNLIINGIQSVPASKRPIINLRLYRSEEEETIIMEVQDNGQGIPESIRQKIFMPNFSTKAGGSGLGLAMAKRGIEHANGNLWFETSHERGTTFYLDLPLSTKTISHQV